MPVVLCVVSYTCIWASRLKTEFVNDLFFLPDEGIDGPGSTAPIPASGVPSGILS